MATTKHTPTPWEFSPYNWRNELDVSGKLYVVGNVHVDEDEDGDTVCLSTAVCIIEGNPTGREVATANAVYMVRAVNCHDELLAACKLWDEGFTDGEQFTPEQLLTWMNKNRAASRAAIAKATTPNPQRSPDAPA